VTIGAPIRQPCLHDAAVMFEPTARVSSCAESKAVEDASYARVSRLAPADRRRALSSPDIVEAYLGFATH